MSTSKCYVKANQNPIDSAPFIQLNNLKTYNSLVPMD